MNPLRPTIEQISRFIKERADADEIMGTKVPHVSIPLRVLESWKAELESAAKELPDSGE